MPPALGEWFRARYGAAREQSAADRASRVIELAAADVPRDAGAPTAGFLPAAPALCVDRALEEDQPLLVARREAAVLAADAVARRQLARRGLLVPGLGRVRLSPAGEPLLPINPALVDEQRRLLRDRILARVQRLEDAKGWLPARTVAYAAYCD